MKFLPLTTVAIMSECDPSIEDAELAYKYLKRLVREHPSNGMLWLRFGDFLYREWNAPGKTLSAYEEAQRLLPHLDLRLQLGRALVNSGRDAEGLRLLSEYAQENPLPHAFTILAFNHIKMQNFSKARECARTAIGLEQDFDEAHYLLGEAFYRDRSLGVDDRFQQSCNSFRSALGISPDYHLAWRGLGQILVENEETRGEGIDALRKAITLDKEDGWSMLYLANALWSAGRLEEADDSYKMAILAFPDYPECKKWYAEFLRSGNKVIDKGSPSHGQLSMGTTRGDAAPEETEN